MLDGYNEPIRKDGYGGVALYCHKSIVCKRMDQLEYLGIESIWIEVIVASKKYLFAVYYRPPGANAADKKYFLDKFEHSLIEAQSLNPYCILITGDFNDRCVTWLDTHERSELQLRLVRLIDAYNMHQIVGEPTRLLDLIITHSPNLVSSCQVLSQISTCDHSPVACFLTAQITLPHKHKCIVWNYQASDFLSMNMHFQPIHGKLPLNYLMISMILLISLPKL